MRQARTGLVNSQFSRPHGCSKGLARGLMKVEYRLKPSELSELGSGQRVSD